MQGLEPDRARATGYSRAQRHDVRLIALLRGASLLGDAVALVALYLRVAPLGHSWAIAALAIASSAPLVAFAPLAGYVIDHVSAKALLSALGLGEAVVCTGLGYWHGLFATLSLMFALNVIVAFSMPGYSALLTTIAGDANVARAQAMMQSVYGVASVAGPALGGLLVGWVGQSWPLYLDASSFALAGLATTLVHRDRRPSRAVGIERLEREGMMAGVTLIMRDNIVRPLVINTFVFLLSLGMVNVAEVFYVTRTFHASATYYGLIGTSFGVGLIVGSLYARRLAQRVLSLARVLTFAIIFVGVMIFSIGLVSRVDYIYPLMSANGVAVGVANVAALTLFTLRTPEAVRGRMFAAVGAIFTAAELGATALGGLVLVVLSPRRVFQLSGAVATLSALVLGAVALRASTRAHLAEASAQGA